MDEGAEEAASVGGGERGNMADVAADEDIHVPRARASERYAVADEPAEDMELSELFLQLGEAMYRLKKTELLAEARLRPLAPQPQHAGTPPPPPPQ